MVKKWWTKHPELSGGVHGHDSKKQYVNAGWLISNLDGWYNT